jgi:hypothetical protein
VIGRAAEHRLDLDRLGIAAFLVVLGVLGGLRLFEIGPWSWPTFDLWAYWLTRGGLDYDGVRQGVTGAYLYSPAFAQAIAGLTALPWPLFAAIWTVLAALPLAWLAGRHSAGLLVVPFVFISVVGGQLDAAFAAVAILGLRWPALWALPILTKVTPGVCLVWYAARREWRSLGLALATTAAVVGVSVVLDRDAWRGWIDMLLRAEFPALGGYLIYLPLPLWLRLLGAALLVAWGARTDRAWVLPIGLMLALPTVYLNAPTILAALLPFMRAGSRSGAAAWLRSVAVVQAPVAQARRQVRSRGVARGIARGI